jgi:endonuclease/exonuclease/phosphatase (EEP) superfamily protein YafD
MNRQKVEPKKYLISLLGLGAIATCLLSLIGTIGGNRYLDLLANFQLQYLLASLVIASFLACTRYKKLLFVALICVGINLREIVPWYLPSSLAASPSSSEVRILMSNLYGYKNDNYEGAIAFIRQEKPQIAAFVEFTKEWQQQFEVLQDIFPYSKTTPGAAIYSQQPLDNVEVKYFTARRNPSIVADFNLNGQKVSLIATHPRTPLAQRNFENRNQHLDAIAQYVQTLKNPAVVIGDLNITMWSKYYKNLEQKTGLRNARQGFGLMTTWPRNRLPIPGILEPLFSIPIDHCLVSSDIQVADFRTGLNIGSDHLPLVVDLRISKKQ